MALALGDGKAPVTWGMPAPHTLLVVTGDSPTLDLIPPGMVKALAHQPIRATQVGERVRLAAILNPYRTRRDRETLPDGSRRVTRQYRVPVPDSERAEWVSVRIVPVLAPDAPIQVRDLPASTGRRPDGQIVTTARVLVTVTGHVIDPDALHHRLTEGHGHARAYGAGLHVLGADQ
jgi:hypothetical protein